MNKGYDRLHEESDTQWLAFCCYRNLGAVRSPLNAYLIYLEKRGKARKGEKRQSQISSSFRQWGLDFSWDDRCKAWDLETEAREQELRLQDDKESYLEQIKEFREFQIKEGRSAVLASIAVKELLSEFLMNVDEIKTLDEAEKLARIGKFLEGGAEILAKGLAIDHVLQELLNGKK